MVQFNYPKERGEGASGPGPSSFFESEYDLGAQILMELLKIFSSFLIQQILSENILGTVALGPGGSIL